MFLDDELLQICKEAELDTSESIQALNIALCSKCELYYKARIKPEMASSQAKRILDRVFNLWDSFVRQAQKDEDKTMNVLGELFEVHSFKAQFLKNQTMADIYNKL